MGIIGFGQIIGPLSGRAQQNPISGQIIELFHGRHCHKVRCAGCAHILIFGFHSTDYVLKYHPMHPGVIFFYPRVRSLSSQTTKRPLAAPRCADKAPPGALIVFSDHYKATIPDRTGCSPNGLHPVLS